MFVSISVSLTKSGVHVFVLTKFFASQSKTFLLWFVFSFFFSMAFLFFVSDTAAGLTKLWDLSNQTVHGILDKAQLYLSFSLLVFYGSIYDFLLVSSIYRTL